MHTGLARHCYEAVVWGSGPCLCGACFQGHGLERQEWRGAGRRADRGSHPSLRAGLPCWLQTPGPYRPVEPRRVP